MTDRDEILKQVYQASGDIEKLSASYDRWADSYDADLWAMGYRYPFMMAGTLGRYVPGLGSNILDAGCGSGLIGHALSLVGYKHLTGIDISKGMLAKAKAKGCYQALQTAVLGERLPFDNSTFDTIVSSGVMTVGHAPPDCLDDLARVLKSGGHFVVSIVREAWEEGYRDAAHRLAADGVIAPVSTTDYFVVLPGAQPEEQNEARVHVMRRL